MKIAVMYSDSSDMTVAEKIKKYSSFYTRKFGVVPEVCHIHPSLIDSITKDERDGLDVEIISDISILINNFWIGIEKGTFKFYSEVKISSKELEE